eukprot:CAMPEP_0184314932 /NCGR_PEP_ID=MMETSP1049-20130417/78611_1 /TAXON_ID=77928 /ORGANISM="Proteomonas sulcata, Strain CCMP704" /LENGTH=61 /DNA_ID=CAMNT_0026633141 /DNA_START=75 /DNA_END=260 /DNA_ORIENTATION=+
MQQALPQRKQVFAEGQEEGVADEENGAEEAEEKFSEEDVEEPEDQDKGTTVTETSESKQVT